MSRPIVLTKDDIERITQEFSEFLSDIKMFNGNIEYSEKFKYKDEVKATVKFNPEAFIKMLTLINTSDEEVAWHGVCHRSEDDVTLFYIDDIIVYPQYVTGVTVNTDLDEYSEWLYSYDDNVFNNIRMQGHSHVNMGTSPSSTDTEHQSKILEQLDDSMYYIFMICNKKLESTTKIYDLTNNVLYEDSDIDIVVDGMDVKAFLSESKSMIKKKFVAKKVTPSKSNKEEDNFPWDRRSAYGFK